jgi:hypothetical protein
MRSGESTLVAEREASDRSNVGVTIPLEQVGFAQYSLKRKQYEELASDAVEEGRPARDRQVMQRPLEGASIPGGFRKAALKQVRELLERRDRLGHQTNGLADQSDVDECELERGAVGEQVSKL